MASQAAERGNVVGGVRGLRSWMPASTALLMLPAVAFMLGFYILPLGRLLESSFHLAGEGTSLAAYSSVLTSRRFWLSLERTLRVSALATVLSFLISLPICLYLVGAGRRMRTFILVTTFVSLSASLIVRNYGWLVVLADAGPVNRLLMALGITSQPLRLVYSEGATLLALTHYALPFMILPVYGALTRLKPSIWEAAQSLGASPFASLMTVVLPQIMPGIYGGTALTFAIGASIFVTPIMLGSPSTAFVSQLAADEFLVQLDFPRGAAVVVVLTVATFLALAIYTFAVRRIGRTGV